MAKKKKYIWSIDGELPIIDDHSKVKLDIIASYLGVYLETYSQNPQIRNLKLSIVDGFTGGGLYKGDITGSPIRILDSIKKAKQVIAFNRESQNLPKIDFNIDYHFVEKCKEAFKFLLKTLDYFGYGDEKINKINAEFEASLEQIILSIKTKSRSERCLFVLDQYGYMDATIVTVKYIFDNIKNAEVILTFSTDSLIDYISEQNAQLLENLGLRRQDIEEILDVKEDNHSTRAKIQPLLYKGIVKAAGAKFYTPFFIKSDVSNRSYWLFHFSSVARARDEMVKLHWSHKNTFAHYGGAGLHMLGYDSGSNSSLFYFDDFAKDLSIKTLTEDLPKVVYDFKAISFENLKNHILNTTPATVDMIKSSLSYPISSGDIGVVAEDGVTRRAASAIKDSDIITCQLNKQGKLF